MTNKTELAMFLLMVVREMKVGTVDMWDTSLTVEDRLAALRFDKIIHLIIFCQAPAPTCAKLCWDFKQMSNKTEVESVQLGNTYIADMDKCCMDKCRGDSCNLLYMFPGPFV